MMKEKVQEYKMFLIIVLMAIMGASSAFFKIALLELPMSLVTFFRFIFALIILAPFFINGEKEIVENKKRLILISIVGAANVFIFIFGLPYTTATIAGMLYACVPLVTATLASFLLHEQVSVKKWLGIVVGFLGVLVIVLAPALHGASAWAGSLHGNLIIFVAVLAFCFYTVISKKYSNEYSPKTLVKYFFATTLVLQTIFLLFHSSEFSLVSHISLKTWIAVGYAGFLGAGLYYLLYQYVTKKVSPVLASTTFFLQPLAGIGWAWLLLHEEVTNTFWVGTIFIFIGMAIVFHEQYSANKIKA